MLADWFAWKNIDDSIIFITVPLQVRSITDEIIPLQSGSVSYKRAKLTGSLYKHRVIYKGWSYNKYNVMCTSITKLLCKYTSI